jgi:DNA-binding response OmpR family regulator
MPVPKKKILAIDDDASICDFYLQGLPMIGFAVDCASSAKKAKEYLKTQKPDLILMDIMMPEMDGISLTKELRADTKTADIPIVVVSGLADAGTLNDALLFGAVDYMVKPVDLDALKAKLERTFAALERRRRPA